MCLPVGRSGRSEPLLITVNPVLAMTVRSVPEAVHQRTGEQEAVRQQAERIDPVARQEQSQADRQGAWRGAGTLVQSGLVRGFA
jgi:hypothetical protein